MRMHFTAALLGLLCAVAPGWSAEAAAAAHAKPTAAVDDARATMPEGGKKVFSAMDELRAAQTDPKAPRHSTGPTKASEAAERFARAQMDFMNDYFKVPARQELTAGKTEDEKAFNREIGIAAARLKSGRQLWDDTAPNCSIAAMAYAKIHHIEWLEEMCNGGAKRYASKGKK